MTDAATIKFKATIGKTAITPGSGTPGEYGYKPGSFDVTFRVSQPDIKLSAPGKRMYLDSDYVDISLPPGPAPERLPKEKDVSFSKREGIWRKHRDAHERYLTEFGKFNEQMQAYQPQMLAWAQLLGLSGLFGGKEVLVSLSPHDQNLLPGFTLDALAPPASAVETPAQLAARVTAEAQSDLEEDDLSDLEDEDEPKCVVCGCTDDEACDGGCSWFDNPAMENLCSRCADTPEGAKLLGLVGAAGATPEPELAGATA